MSSHDPVFLLTEENRSKRRWNLHLMPDSLALEPIDGGPAHVVQRKDAPEAVRLIEWPTASPLLAVKTDKTHTFKLPSEAASAARTWIGPLSVEHLKAALKRRRWIEVATALLLLSISISQ